MTAQVFNIRDYQRKLSKQAVDETAKAFEAEFGYPLAATEFNAQLAVWPDFSAANVFHAPEKDPA